MSDSYLELAQKAIKRANKPLHPRQIINLANEAGEMPSHLSGKTQYKTLAARLSTEIRERGNQSPFCRTGANLFFLRELLDPDDDEYLAPRRKKTIHSERILTIPAGYLNELKLGSVIPDAVGFLQALQEESAFSYSMRRDAEVRYDIKQLISYTLVWKSGKLLTYRRGHFTNAADELQGLRSIGFGGHVNDTDANLFDGGNIGVIENARREICEELVISNAELGHMSSDENFSLLCILNTDDTDEARKHLGVTIVYFCSSGFEAQKNEMSINDLRWCGAAEISNNLDDFEPWSQLLLQKLHSGVLKIV